MTTDGDFPCCATPERMPGRMLGLSSFTDAWTRAAAAAMPGTMVLFEPEGSAPGAESSVITSVTYEEAFGAVVIRGRPGAWQEPGLARLGEVLAGTLIVSASVDAIMAGLRRLDPARFDEVRRRMALLDGLDYEGSPEAWYALHPADRAALIAPATDPEVIRCAALVMDAIHADMARTDLPPGLAPIPRDVGGFSRLQDWRDANEYLIRLIPHIAPDCDCGTSTEQTSAGEVHADDCGSREEGGSHDAWGTLAERVSTEVDRLLAAEAAELAASRCASCNATGKLVRLYAHSDPEPWRPGSYADGVVAPCDLCAGTGHLPPGPARFGPDAFEQHVRITAGRYEGLFGDIAAVPDRAVIVVRIAADTRLIRQADAEPWPRSET